MPDFVATEDANKTPQQLYDEVKNELQSLLSRKKQVDNSLATLESQIYAFEGSYLEDTQQNGNIIKGFDGYLTGRSDKKKRPVMDSDRLFSLSSTTYLNSLALREEKDQSSSSVDDRSPAHSLNSSKKTDNKKKMRTSDIIESSRHKKKIRMDSEELEV